MKKRNYLPVLLAGIPFTAHSGIQQQEEEKPNIIVILADDLGTCDLSCYGGKNLVTPNIDRLAGEGILMTNNHASSAMSVPIRASLFTGLYPTRHGSFQNHKATYDNVKSITHYMPQAGYRLARAGKQHTNPKSVYQFEELPGFKVNCNSTDASYNIDGIKEFINRDNTPFCLFICSINTHRPWTWGDPGEFDPDKVELHPNYVDNKATREIFCKYLAEVRALDNEVGSVLEVLEKSGKLDNTIVIFLGEQGPCMPFAKWTCYRYGQNSAFIARYPKKIAAGSRSDALVQYEDILPTLMDIAGSNTINGIDGFSCLPVLYGKKKDHREWSYGIHNNIPEGTSYPIRSIQDKRYKLIVNLTPEVDFYEQHMMKAKDLTQVWLHWIDSTDQGDENAKFLTGRYVTRPGIEFYDLQEDPWELENIADIPEHADRITEMRVELEKWMKLQGDQGVSMDSKNPEDPANQTPVAISDYNDLQVIRNNLNGNYYLTTDIAIPDNVTWIPIGAVSSTDTNPKGFTGKLDGRGYNINNVNVNGGNFSGFFGRVCNGAQVMNLNLINVNIIGGTPTGGLTSTIYGGVKIENIYITGTIQGAGEVGGITGRNNGTEENSITDCYVNANISGTGANTVHVGGLIGTVNGKNVIITNAYTAGKLSAKATNKSNNYTGGIIGTINNEMEGALIKAESVAVLVDEIIGGTPNLLLGTVLKETDLTCNNVYVRNDITLTYADNSNKGTGEALIKESMKRPLADFTSQNFYENILGWDFEYVWDMKAGYHFPILRRDGSNPNEILNFTEKDNQNCEIYTLRDGVRIIPIEPISISIHNLSGSMMSSAKEISNRVELRLARGVYLIKTESKGGRVQSCKVIMN